MSDGGVVNREALRDYVDRVVSLQGQRDELSTDIREVYKEAKDAGIDTTVLREIVREARMEPEARHSRYSLLDSYRQALGLDYATTPLGEAAMTAAAGDEVDAAMREHRFEADGSITVLPYPAKPFAEQPIKRGRGRPRKAQNGDDRPAA